MGPAASTELRGRGVLPSCQAVGLEKELVGRPPNMGSYEFVPLVLGLALAEVLFEGELGSRAPWGFEEEP